MERNIILDRRGVRIDCGARERLWDYTAFGQLLHASSAEVCHQDIVHGPNLFDTGVVLLIFP